VNALLASKQLLRLGFRVTVVANGQEAVNTLGKERFDLVLMDCQMPVMHGLEATRLIRQLASDAARVPIVAMTANAQSADREECLAAGMDDYLSKPASLADLRGVLERWLPSRA
jgi:CheY-like chemotaxis protein